MMGCVGVVVKIRVTCACGKRQARRVSINRESFTFNALFRLLHKWAPCCLSASWTFSYVDLDLEEVTIGSQEEWIAFLGYTEAHPESIVLNITGGSGESMPCNPTDKLESIPKPISPPPQPSEHSLPDPLFVDGPSKNWDDFLNDIYNNCPVSEQYCPTADHFAALYGDCIRFLLHGPRPRPTVGEKEARLFMQYFPLSTFVPDIIRIHSRNVVKVGLDRKATEQLLAGSAPGTFFLRPSATHPGTLAITMATSSGIQNKLISLEDGKISISRTKPTHVTLPELVDRLLENQSQRPKPEYSYLIAGTSSIIPYNEG
eukprot:Sspe_Gene.44576::Locus_21871_Transcript_1_1_Confidence_1.000_Length_1166::g.44576::m.44576